MQGGRGVSLGNRLRESKVGTEEFGSLREALSRDGVLRCTVATGCMSPLIKAGDSIDIAPFKRDPEVFDIVVFWDGSRMVCHFIWHRNYLSAADGQELFVTRN